MSVHAQPCVVSYAAQLDQRLKEEALELVGLSLGCHTEFEYVRTARALCEFAGGHPRVFTVRPKDPRSLEFLKELQIVRAAQEGFALNVRINTDPDRPLLTWDWHERP